MLAPPEKPKPVPGPEKPAPERKRRIITLTNRAPIRIIEEDWPVIAQGVQTDNLIGSEAPYGWEIAIRVRMQNMQQPDKKGNRYSGRHIVHANYSSHAEDDEDDYVLNQYVRVGRLLTWDDAANNLWKHIHEVGEELRERINNEKLRRYVTNAVDRCFASLTPFEE